MKKLFLFLLAISVISFQIAGVSEAATYHIKGKVMYAIVWPCLGVVEALDSTTPPYSGIARANVQKYGDFDISGTDPRLATAYLKFVHNGDAFRVKPIKSMVNSVSDGNNITIPNKKMINILATVGGVGHGCTVQVRYRLPGTSVYEYKTYTTDQYGRAQVELDNTMNFDQMLTGQFAIDGAITKINSGLYAAYVTPNKDLWTPFITDPNKIWKLAIDIAIPVAPTTVNVKMCEIIRGGSVGATKVYLDGIVNVRDGSNGQPFLNSSGLAVAKTGTSVKLYGFKGQVAGFSAKAVKSGEDDYEGSGVILLDPGTTQNLQIEVKHQPSSTTTTTTSGSTTSTTVRLGTGRVVFYVNHSDKSPAKGYKIIYKFVNGVYTRLSGPSTVIADNADGTTSAIIFIPSDAKYVEWVSVDASGKVLENWYDGSEKVNDLHWPTYRNVDPNDGVQTIDAQVP